MRSSFLIVVIDMTNFCGNHERAVLSKILVIQKNNADQYHPSINAKEVNKESQSVLVPLQSIVLKEYHSSCGPVDSTHLQYTPVFRH
jgi:hypothetical protein